jgi:hypothetical protein
MLPKADLVVKEVPSPHGLWCKSGHSAPTEFHRDGEKGEAQPTRFFQIASNANPQVNGVYCEPCLVLAHAMQRNEIGVKPR